MEASHRHWNHERVRDHNFYGITLLASFCESIKKKRKVKKRKGKKGKEKEKKGREKKREGKGKKKRKAKQISLASFLIRVT